MIYARLLAQDNGTIDQLASLVRIAEFGVPTIVALVLLAIAAIMWSNGRNSNKMVTAILGLYGDTTKRQNALDERLDNQERIAEQRHVEYTAVQSENVTLLQQLVTAVGCMKDEVVAMRDDNKSIAELQAQLTQLQATVQSQARQLEDQALEITRLTESNEALTANLMQERQAKAELETELQQERDRKQKEIELLKTQFRQLQDEFMTYKLANQKPTQKSVTKPKAEDKPTDDVP